MVDVKGAADDISPGFGDKIFDLVREFQPCEKHTHVCPYDVHLDAYQLPPPVLRLSTLVASWDACPSHAPGCVYVGSWHEQASCCWCLTATWTTTTG